MKNIIPLKDDVDFSEMDNVIKDLIASATGVSKLIKDIETATRTSMSAIAELRKSLNKIPVEYLYTPTGVCLECGTPFSDASTVCKRCAPLKIKGE